jgi:hypothetical protein
MQPSLVAAGAALAAAFVAPFAPQEQAARMSAPPSGGLAWADVDVDGLPDLLARGAGGALVLLRNTGDGGFADVTASYRLEGLAGVRHAAWKDADGDGLADLLLLDGAGRPTLLRHMGAFFVDASAGSGLEGVAGAQAEQWLDFDGDGREDLLLSGAGGGVLLHNLGELRFERVDLPIEQGAPPVLPETREPDAVRTVDAADAPQEVEREREDDGDTRRPVVLEGSGGSSAALGVGGVARAPSRDPAGGIAAVNCVPSMLDQAGGPCLEGSSTPLLGAFYPLTIDLNVVSGGNVGMGTTQPLGALHIATASPVLAAASLFSEDIILEAADAVLGLFSTQSGAWGSALTLGQNASNGTLHDKWSFARQTSAPGTGNGSLHLTYGSDPNYSLNASVLIAEPDGDVGIGNAPGNNQLYVGHDGALGNAARIESYGAGNASPALSVYHNGNAVAINAVTNSGDHAITASGKTGVYTQGSVKGLEAYSGSGTALHARTGSDSAQPAALLQSYGDLPTVMITNFNSTNPQAMSIGGDVHIGYPGFAGLTVDRVVLGVDSTNAGFFELWNDLNEATIILDASSGGKGRITTEVLEITGGADLVEGFDTREEGLEPGSVMVIDAERAGELALSRAAYDTRVAGIVSGAGGIEPGLRMGQEGVASGDTLVALTGRVYVKASAENGAIRPGDRLTTSSTPGHAMRVADESRAPGAVIGKAMGALESGTGLVLVLVNLQ